MDNILALNYWVLGGFDGILSPQKAIAMVKSFGLSAIELSVGDCLKTTMTQTELEDIRDYANKADVALPTLATGQYWTCSLAAVEREERECALQFTRTYIDMAANLGIDTILITGGTVDVAWDDTVPVTPYHDVWNHALDSLKTILPYAATKKVRLAVENVWSKFLLSPMEMKHFISQVESDYLGVYLDVGNVCAFGYAEHWIPVLADKIFAVHLKNYERSDCLGGLHGFTDDLERGDVNFDAVFAELQKIAYTGPLTAEMIPFCRLPDMVLPDERLAAETARKLKKICEGRKLTIN